jgi:hypothetical protein
MPYKHTKINLKETIFLLTYLISSYVKRFSLAEVLFSRMYEKMSMEIEGKQKLSRKERNFFICDSSGKK